MSRPSIQAVASAYPAELEGFVVEAYDKYNAAVNEKDIAKATEMLLWFLNALQSDNDHVFFHTAFVPILKRLRAEHVANAYTLHSASPQAVEIENKFVRIFTANQVHLCHYSKEILGLLDGLKANNDIYTAFNLPILRSITGAALLYLSGERIDALPGLRLARSMFELQCATRQKPHQYVISATVVSLLDTVFDAAHRTAPSQTSRATTGNYSGVLKSIAFELADIDNIEHALRFLPSTANYWNRGMLPILLPMIAQQPAPAKVKALTNFAGALVDSDSLAAIHTSLNLAEKQNHDDNTANRAHAICCTYADRRRRRPHIQHLQVMWSAYCNIVKVLRQPDHQNSRLRSVFPLFQLVRQSVQSHEHVIHAISTCISMMVSTHVLSAQNGKFKRRITPTTRVVPLTLWGIHPSLASTVASPVNTNKVKRLSQMNSKRKWDTCAKDRSNNAESVRHALKKRRLTFGSENKQQKNLNPDCTLPILSLLRFILPAIGKQSSLKELAHILDVAVSCQHMSPTPEQYSEMLPKKSVFKRDLYIEKLFLACPALYQVLCEITQNKEAFLMSRATIMSLLAISIGNWNNALAKKLAPADSPHLTSTVHLLEILRQAGFLPAPLCIAPRIIWAIDTSNVIRMLLGIFSYLCTALYKAKEAVSPSPEIQQLFKFIVLKHIVKLKHYYKYCIS